jgi:deoxyribodipyrimidine photolyase-related protein
MLTNSLNLVLGDQLYKENPLFELSNDFIMIESLDFADYQYHKSRLLHCFVSMREYSDELKKSKFNVEYWQLKDEKKIRDVFDYAKNNGKNTINICSIENKKFKIKIYELGKEFNVSINEVYDSKFLTNQKDWNDYRSTYPKRTFFNDFYIFNRKRLKIDVDKDNNSIYGKWSLDEDNRKKIPKNLQFNQVFITFSSIHQEKVLEQIEKYFKNSIGKCDQLNFPINSDQAEKYLFDFIQTKYSSFGDYEDAISYKSPFVFHSCISMLLNNGLLTPNQVIKEINKIEVSSNSREGFIRQIIGWREWVRLLYWNVYSDDLSQYNFFKHNNPLPKYFWDINELESIKYNTPLYNALKNVYEYSYCHHIERLMVISNWCVLNHYDPHEVYQWFMTMFIDSYDWVMVANVYGMGLFADGGIFATKPYISGGNYLKKMSDYPDHKIWESIWTDKFWNFLLKHEEFFKTNPRLSMLISSKKNKMIN